MLFARCVGCNVAITALVALTPSSARSQDPADELSIRVNSHEAPAGAITQVSVKVTEAKPITSGDSHIRWSLGEIDGVALGSDDAAAIAIVRDGSVSLSVVSPTASLGMSSEYLFTLTGRVPADARLGTRLPVRIDADSVRMFDAEGGMYPATEIDNGRVTVANRITIADVVPGSADLPAGSVVSVFGTGFNRRTRVDFDQISLAQVRYVSPTRIDVVLSNPARMHGVRIRAKNEDGYRVTYFSYQRTRPGAPSDDPLLRSAVPVFPFGAARAATLRVGATTVGVALQNVETDTQIFADLTNDKGVAVASAVVPVRSNEYIVRTLGEIFGVPFAGAGTISLTSAGPVQVLGVDVDADGAARPRLPE
jgi:hypothetical protein